MATFPKPCSKPQMLTDIKMNSYRHDASKKNNKLIYLIHYRIIVIINLQNILNLVINALTFGMFIIRKTS